jgi:hypothetical protein
LRGDAFYLFSLPKTKAHVQWFHALKFLILNLQNVNHKIKHLDRPGFFQQDKIGLYFSHLSCELENCRAEKSGKFNFHLPLF